LNALISQAAAGAGYSLPGALAYTASYAAGFSFLVFLIHLVAVSFFKSPGKYAQLLRAAGLAQVWSVVSSLITLLGSFVPVLSLAFTCLGFFLLLVFLAALVVATGESHILSRGQAAVAVLVPLVAFIILVICLASLFVMAFGDVINDTFESIIQELN
jgi:hypothetical protein